jgi:hypothetical protein
MSNVHDNHLVGYDVDGEAGRIVLRTERRAGGAPFQKTEVVFEGVEAYSFRHDCLSNIVFDISEEPMDVAIQEHWAEFEASHRQSGWPRFWHGDESKMKERLAALVKDGAKWFELSSSYGMEGWVLCRSIEYRARRPQQ